MTTLSDKLGEVIYHLTKTVVELEQQKSVVSVATQTDLNNVDLATQNAINIEKLLVKRYNEIDALSYSELLNWAIMYGYADMGQTYTKSKLVQIALNKKN